MVLGCLSASKHMSSDSVAICPAAKISRESEAIESEVATDMTPTKSSSISTHVSCHWNEDRTICSLNGVDYACVIIPGHQQWQRTERAPSSDCLSGEHSWGVCRNGQYLCKKFTADVLWKLAIATTNLDHHSFCSELRQIFFISPREKLGYRDMALNLDDVERALSFLAGSSNSRSDHGLLWRSVMMHTLRSTCPAARTDSLRFSFKGLAKCCARSWIAGRSRESEAIESEVATDMTPTKSSSISTHVSCHWNEDRTICSLNGVDYACVIIPGHQQWQRTERAPSSDCLSGEHSWGVCRNGQYLCKKFTADVLWKLAIATTNLDHHSFCSELRQIFFISPREKLGYRDMALNLDDVERALSFLAGSSNSRSDHGLLWRSVMMHTLRSTCPAARTDSLRFSFKGLAKCCARSWTAPIAGIQTQNFHQSKIASITVCWNEEHVVTFTVGALIEHVDLYIVIDTGSTDNSVSLLRSIFGHQIRAGKLVVEEMPVGGDVFEARNAALDIARLHNCTHVLKVDADQVFYDEGAAKLIQAVRLLPNDVQLVWVPQNDLFQWTIPDTLEWLLYIQSDLSRTNNKFDKAKRQSLLFRGTKLAYGHDCVYALTEDLAARGRWTDEARGLDAEDFYHSSRGKFVFLISDVPLITHYGFVLLQPCCVHTLEYVHVTHLLQSSPKVELAG